MAVDMIPLLAPPAWVEPWTNLDSWQAITQPCLQPNGNGLLVGTCQSAALQSKPRWTPSKPLSVTVRIRADSAPDSSTDEFFAGVAFIQRDDPYMEYTHSTVQRDHLWPMASGTVLGVFEATEQWHDGGPGAPWVWSEHRTELTPLGGGLTNVRHLIDGLEVYQYQTSVFTGGLAVWLGCVSVKAGQPDNGSAARCEFGPVLVDGELVPAPRRPSRR